jgi:hypothetical protein
VGTPILTSSAALGLMTWRDLDVTVAYRRSTSIQSFPSRGGSHAIRIFAMSNRDDSGRRKPRTRHVPGGLFSGLRYQQPAELEWRLNVRFVDRPRAPNLEHLDFVLARPPANWAHLDARTRVHGSEEVSTGR